MTSNYDTIHVLEGMEHVRKRAGMYIGSTETPTHLAVELIDNAIDEAGEGATRISIFTSESHVSVQDNGRGFPVLDSKGNDAIVTACTQLFSGGKFDSTAYNVSKGLNGIGLTACNALSSYMTVESRRKKESSVRVRRFLAGALVEERTHTEFDQGTRVTLAPNPEYFESTQVDDKKLKENCRLAVTLNPGMVIEYNGKTITPYSEAELLAKDLMTPLWKVDVSDDSGQAVTLYFGYTNSVDWHLKGAVNRSRCDEGTHINAAVYAIYEAWENFVKGRQIERYDTAVGLCIFVSANVREPAYTSQTKEKLDLKVSQLLDLRRSLTDAVEKLLSKNDDIRKKLIKKFEEYRRQVNRINAGSYLEEVVEYGTDDTGTVKRSGNLKTKLIECLSDDRESTELIIVEGDSAAGPAIVSRDRDKHAILPLRGKILNVVDGSIQKILDNVEVRDLINGIGAGAFHKQDVSRIRYGKIVIATDADADGSQIMALLVGCLCYVVPDVVLGGRVYIAKSPLFSQWRKGEYLPVYREEDIDPSLPFERNKGLGSMDNVELHTVLFNEEKRRLVQLHVDEEDIARILHIVSTSVGKKEVLQIAGLLDDYVYE